MLKIFLRSLAAMLAATASVPAFFASIARIDSFTEQKEIMQFDAILGFLFATAFLLCRFPHAVVGRAKNRLITAVGFLCVWGAITGFLLCA